MSTVFEKEAIYNFEKAKKYEKDTCDPKQKGWSVEMKKVKVFEKYNQQSVRAEIFLTINGQSLYLGICHLNIIFDDLNTNKNVFLPKKKKINIAKGEYYYFSGFHFSFALLYLCEQFYFGEKSRTWKEMFTFDKEKFWKKNKKIIAN